MNELREQIKNDAQALREKIIELTDMEGYDYSIDDAPLLAINDGICDLLGID